MNKLIQSVFIILVTSICYGQDIIMSNGNSVQCDGNFYDSGGQGDISAERYGHNENFVYTICPEPGNLIQVDFSFFDVDAGDGLTIYDGNSTAGVIIGTYNASSVLTGVIRATEATGCLTFEFNSDDVVRAGGWEAAISCYLPCQSVLANAIFSEPLENSFIELCQNSNVTMNGSGTYSENNTLYAQSDATSTFNWVIKSPAGSNTILNGNSANFNFSEEGVYVVTLKIQDINGCKNTDLENQIVLVSTTPSFVGTMAENDTVCLGETLVFSGNVTPITATQNCSPEVGDDVFLPDGNGQSYETTSEVGCYNDGQVLTNISEIESICIDMEHSYLGDLTIAITCPSGQTVLLHDYDGSVNSSGQYLGEPIDSDASIEPGHGYEYCFTMNGTQTLDQIASTTSSGTSIPAGQYLPWESFSGLIGCELNGAWKVTITDDLPSDNGYIFNWGIEFSDFLPTNEVSFTPVIISQSWNPNPSIQSVNGNQITVLPTTLGNNCYTYSTTDDFGCTYDTTICVFVKDVPFVNPILDQTVCEGEDFNDIIFTGSANVIFNWTNDNPSIGIAPEGQGDLVGIYGTGTLPLGPDLVSVFTVTPSLEGGCEGVPITFNLTVNSAEDASFDIDDSYCSTQGIQIPIMTSTTPGGFFESFTGVTVDPITGQFDVSLLPDGQYEITYNTPGNTGFCFTNSSEFFTVVNPATLTVDLPASQSICDNTMFSQTIFTGDNQFAQYSWTNDNTAIGLAASGVGNIPSFLAQGTVDGSTNSISANITVTPFSGNCVVGLNSQSFILTVNPKPILVVSNDKTICEGQSVSIEITNTSVTPINCIWDNSFVGIAQDVTPTQTTKYKVVATDQNGCSNSDSLNVIVNENPIVDAGVYPIICINSSSIQLAGTPNGGTFTGFGVTNGFFNPQFDDQTITYTYIDPTTSCMGSSNVLIDVSQLPNVVIDPVTPICIGESTDLFVSGAKSYFWDNGLGSGDTKEITPGQTTLYNVLGTDVNGCQNTASIQVIVNNLPIISAGNDLSICLGEDTIITVTGGTSYMWDQGVGAGSTHTVSPIVTTTYTVVGTDINGCVNTADVTVNIDGPPVISANNDTTICAGNPITLIGTGTTFYSWNNGVADNVPFDPPTGVTTYGLTGTSADGCTAYVEVIVTVLPQPNPNFTASETMGTPTLTVDFTNLSENASTYTWNFGNGDPVVTVNDLSSQTSTYSIIQSYSVTLTASNGLCSNDTTIIITVINFDPVELEVPNIFSPQGDGKNDLYHLNVKNVKSLEAQIFNRWGNLVYEINGVFDPNVPATYWDGKINDKEAKDGVYFIKYSVLGFDGLTTKGHENIQLVR